MRIEGVPPALPDRSWVVVNTQPKRETCATENLQRQEFEVYCPMTRKRLSHARRVSDVLRPLFPSYVFVSISSGRQRWRPILSTYGVRGIVRCGNELSALDPRFVDNLRAREVDGAVVRPASPFRVGQTVQMTGGPFDGIVATILSMDDKDRARTESLKKSVESEALRRAAGS